MTAQESTGADFMNSAVDGFAKRAFLRGSGYSASEVRRRPVIGVCSSWSELTPCNRNLRDLAERVKAAVVAEGGIAYEFPTISLSEPYIAPTTLYLRNLMSIDVEEMIRAAPIDGVVLLNGCDKTVPAQLMGAISADKPAISLSAGPRDCGQWHDQDVTVDDIWRLADERRRGDVSEDDWLELEGCVSTSVGTCNVMGTAVTMASVAEALGLALPGTALLPATSEQRREKATETGHRIVALAKEQVRPSQIVDRGSICNAVRVTTAVGGSANAIIHILAIAGRRGLGVTLADVAGWMAQTPQLTRVRPSGVYSLADLERVGAIPAVVRELDDLFDTSRLSVHGGPWSAALPPRPREPHPVLGSLAEPAADQAALVVLRGSLAPGGAIFKRSAASPTLHRHTGPAVVFEGLDDMHARIDDADLEITKDSVLVLRNCGPASEARMPEVGALPIPTKLLRAGVKDMLRLSDARMSGTGSGAVVLHIAPEASVGGPLGLVQDGDLIELDSSDGRLDLLVDDEELQGRRTQTPAQDLPLRGYGRLYRQHITQADQGCDFDFLRAVP